MNLTKLKNYAPAARNALINAVTQRAVVLGIRPTRGIYGPYPEAIEPVRESGDVALIGGRPFPRSIVPLRLKLISMIEAEGFQETMESMAYTWFNRLVALRFMELHDGYLDHGYRVLSHPQGTPLPEILQHAEHVSLKGLDREEVIRLKLDGNRDEELYRLLLLAQCAELNQILPDVFSKLDDATILLLPDNLLHSDSVIRQLVAGSDAEDWQQVEVLGWLYQFYISEKKDAVMARKSAVPTEDIPAVTQLFTPHWIVRYLVENSLGRLWLLNRPGSRLREHMPYYIEGEAETDFLKITKPEEIKLVDPAVGSGHMLTYAFDLLVLIYEEEGYAANEIPGLILRHNLLGLDLCPRAAQLAELALVFKAREMSRRFFSPGNLVRPNIIELRNVRYEENELRDYLQAVDLDPYFESQAHEWIEAGTLLSRQDHFDASETASTFLGVLVAKGGLGPCLDSLDLDPRLYAKLRKLILSGKDISALPAPETRNLEQAAFRFFVKSGEILKYAAELNLGDLSNQVHLKLLHQFEETKNFGSLIQPSLDERAIADFRRAIEAKDLGGQLFLRETQLKVLRVLEQAEALTQRYHVVVANPPYMGGKGMNGVIKQFLQDNFTDYKSDLFAGFIVRSLSLSLPNGFLGFMSPFVWMFISSYEKLRARLISQATITTLVQLEYSGFDGATVPICAFSLQNQHHKDYLGGYVRLSDFRGSENQGPRTLEAIANRNCGWFFRANSASFRKIPGSPIAYWATAKMLSTFDFKKIDSLTTGEGKNVTSDNSRFVRLFWELNASSIGKGQKWLTYAKGGAFRKWQGNLEYVVDWSAEAHSFYKQNKVSRVIPRDLWYRSGITWTDITSSGTGFRYLPENTTFDATGITIFLKEQRAIYPLLGLLNSTFATTLLPILNPTFHAQLIDIKAIPVCDDLPDVVDLVAELVSLATKDWDNFETSWDFRDQPLLRPGLKGATLEASWRNWEAQSTAAIRRMQELETENNRLFIAAYGLEGELQPEVPEEQITLARADQRKDIAAFLSYAVGCMMGRYSPDHPGLILANAGDSLREFLEKVGKPLAELTFAPDEDGIIPVLDGDWFEDDVVARAKEFLRATFGDATLGENLRFIAESLGKELRTYFLNDFYKDHLQTYKNRPIYWQLSSGKQKAFQCLIYLHRYTPATLARIRTEYAIPLQGKLSARITRLEEDVIQTASSAARKKLQTDLDKSKKQIVELLAFDEQLRSYADQAITLDLDDGVKTNYAKFGPLVAEAKKIYGTKDD